MESLLDRFDAVQEQLLELYERDYKDIDSQIQHWELIRRENILLFYARKKGLARLGLHPVPPLKVSENKAKEAIGMSLQLQSLKRSPYGQEEWSLTDTSAEKFAAPPSGTFKKLPKTVTVMYDKNPMNTMEYTLWSSVYVVNNDDMWQKFVSYVDYEGIYFVDDFMQKVYYVLFSDDAQLFSKCGNWDVQYANQMFSAPVTSSTTGTTGGSQTEEGNSTSRSSACSSTTDGTESQSQSTESRSSARGAPRSNRGDPRREEEAGNVQGARHRRRSRSRSRSISRSRTRSRSPRRGRSPRPAESPRSGYRGGGGGGGYPELGTPGGPAPPTPEQVERGSRTVERGPSSRLTQLIKEAYDPPVLLLKGPGNSLKCWRNRCKVKCKGFYHSMSTIFSWVSTESAERLGDSRMLVAFTDSSQRTDFLHRVKFPKHVTYVFGSLDGL